MSKNMNKQHSPEVIEAAKEYGCIKTDRNDSNEQQFNPYGCCRYDGFLAGVEFLEAKIAASQANEEVNTKILAKTRKVAEELKQK